MSDRFTTNLSDMRKPYKDDALIELSAKEPFSLFQKWFNLACNTGEIKEPNAMALCTADKFGRPSSRYVLLKGYGKEGFRFFTNSSSRKGKELAENPYATLLFYWEHLNRQIRIEGQVEQLNEEESDLYFHSRPRSSQISAIVSQQSSIIESREVLIKKQEELENVYSDPNELIPRPHYWVGYTVIPEVIEFWQGQTNRLHDRIRFRHLNPGEVPDSTLTHLGDDGWVYEQLSP